MNASIVEKIKLKCLFKETWWIPRKKNNKTLLLRFSLARNIYESNYLPKNWQIDSKWNVGPRLELPHSIVDLVADLLTELLHLSRPSD